MACEVENVGFPSLHCKYNPFNTGKNLMIYLNNSIEPCSKVTQDINFEKKLKKRDSKGKDC